MTAPPPIRTSLITLGVAELDTAIGFYRAMGLAPSAQSVPGQVCFLPMGALVLALFPWDELARDAAVAARGSGFRGMALAWNLPDRPEVDRTFARAAKAGGRIVKPPQATDWGGYSGYFTDPDGHLWEVAHHPSWPVGADGRIILPD